MKLAAGAQALDKRQRSVWRNPADDFGDDILAEHYRPHHQPPHRSYAARPTGPAPPNRWIVPALGGSLNVCQVGMGGGVGPKPGLGWDMTNVKVCERCRESGGNGVIYGPGCPGCAGASPGRPGTGRPGTGRWSTADKVAGGATLVLLVSLFLPWFEYAGQTADGLWHGFEYITLISSLLILARLALRPGVRAQPSQSLPPRDGLLTAATGINLLLVLIGFLAQPSAAQVVVTITADWDFGALLGLLSAVLAAAVVIGPRLRGSVSGGL